MEVFWREPPTVEAAKFLRIIEKRESALEIFWSFELGCCRLLPMTLLEALLPVLLLPTLLT